MIHVSCAIIENGDEILVCQRSAKMRMPLKWEFPGGKIETGEQPAEALQREIMEELNVHFEPLEALTPSTHHYEEFSITLYPFIGKITAGSLHPEEHAHALWTEIGELRSFDWAAADIPVVEEYIRHKSKLLKPE